MAQQTEKTLEIWTDGACKCNPGIGGWGAYMVWGAHTREMYGGSKLTTNNQMELTAVISALSALRRKCPRLTSRPPHTRHFAKRLAC